MTENKPIMVDGVDVSKCTHYADSECLIDYYLMYGYEISHYGYCKDCKDCYFKQLASKTKECKQAEQKLERIAEFVKTFDEEDETRVIILQIIDEVK